MTGTGAVGEADDRLDRLHRQRGRCDETYRVERVAFAGRARQRHRPLAQYNSGTRDRWTYNHVGRTTLDSDDGGQTAALGSASGSAVAKVPANIGRRPQTGGDHQSIDRQDLIAQPHRIAADSEMQIRPSVKCAFLIRASGAHRLAQLLFAEREPLRRIGVSRCPMAAAAAAPRINRAKQHYYNTACHLARAERGSFSSSSSSSGTDVAASGGATHGARSGSGAMKHARFADGRAPSADATTEGREACWPPPRNQTQSIAVVAGRTPPPHAP
uniref:Uncharacterized protein n=1 Tax=Plectus sambesii TaxID=2011161 RepID=A0A914WLP2_9BILA